RIWVEQAISQAEGAMASFPELLSMFRDYIKFDPVLRQKVDNAIAENRTALKRYIDFLKNELKSGNETDFRVGQYTYGFYLERWHGLDESPAAVSRFAKKTFRQTLEDLKKEASSVDPETADSDFGWKKVLEKAPKDHPAAGDLLKVFQQELERAYQHFDKFKVVPFPRGERLRIKETPAFLASVLPFTSYNPPFPLDEKRVSEFYVTLPSSKLSPAVREKVLEMNFNYPQIEIIVAHEAMPGLYLQNSESAGVSRIRRIASSPLVINGWACYSEWLAQEMGFYTSHWSKLIYLHWRLIRAARAYVDAELHRRRMTYDEALQFFQNEAMLMPSQARAEVLKISLSPSEGISYIMGMDRILHMRRHYERTEERHFDLRDFHRTFLKMGNLPINEIEAEMKRQKKEAKKSVPY
ncbi:MAG: DUF885 domain-containing protein, partial [bacterium]